MAATTTGHVELAPLTLLFQFQSHPRTHVFRDDCAAPNIDGLDNISIKDQLNVLNPSYKSSLIVSVMDKVPDLALYTFARHIARSTRSTPTGNWSEESVALSLFAFLMEQLRTEQLPASVATTIKFVGFTHRFCMDEDFDGRRLMRLWLEQTANGQETDGFGLEFIKTICSKYALKSSEFAHIKKEIVSW